MTLNRAARVFGPLLITTVAQLSDAAPLIDGASCRDAEGRRYGGLVFGRGPRALVLGWRDAVVLAPRLWWRRRRSALLLAVLRLANALLVRVGLAVVVLPATPVVARGCEALLGGVMHIDVRDVPVADAAEALGRRIVRDLGAVQQPRPRA